MLPSDPWQLRQFFPSAIFSRGLEYQKQNRVKLNKVDLVDDRIAAEVKGSGQNIYRVKVAWFNEKDGFYVDGECSCPVGFNCKHVVAVLLAALESELPHRVQLESPSHELSSPVKQWLQRVQENILQEQTPKIKQNSHLIYYILQKDIHANGWSSQVCITVLRSKTLKSGAMSKPQRINMVDGVQWEQLDPVDHEIILQLQLSQQRHHGSRYFYAERFELKDEADAVLLGKILETKRCSWQKLSTECLQLSSPQQGECYWEVQIDGSQRLQCRIAEKNIIVLPLKKPWYVDPTTQTCGLLALDADPTILTTLLTGPSISVEEIAIVREHWQQLTPSVNIPAPASINTQTVTIDNPIPCLYLFSKDIMLRTSWKMKRILGELTFAYGDARIAWHANTNPLHAWDEKHLCLNTYPRHAAAENAALEELSKHNILTVDRIDFYTAHNENGNYFILDHNGVDPMFLGMKIISELQKKGWQISYAKDYEFHFLDPEKANWTVNLEESSGINWFEFELGIEVDGQFINLIPVLLQAIKQNTDLLKSLDQKDSKMIILPLPNNQSLPIPAQRLKKILLTFFELFEEKNLVGDQKLLLSRFQANQLANLNDIFDQELHWQGHQCEQALLRLKEFTSIKSVKLTPNFHGALRPYQQAGVNWLQFLREYQLGGILADDMGLGKTVQALAHLAIEKASGRLQQPCLIIAPTSLMFNWEMESKRFVPELKVIILQGQQRKKHYEALTQYDLVLTTYPLLNRDAEILLQQEFSWVILDEAQAIKNPKTQAAKIVQQLKSEYRLCLSGTPLENHLGELWSLFNFLMPGFLGDQKFFTQVFRTPIEKKQDNDRRQHLLKRIAPFILRRTKDQILPELPPKVLTTHFVELTDEVRDLYETIRLTLQQKLKQQIAETGLNRSHILILDSLLKLRQICCDHRLLKMKTGKLIKQPAPKLVLLMELLEQLLAEGRRILIFSQFTEMLGLIEDQLFSKKIPFEMLTGDTTDRATPVKRFQAGEVNCFLISLKAGGVGLNLTAADTVIHYDPWWNPAVENQATDRAHRIGQTNTVFVYKLIVKGSVEEKIIELQDKKRTLVEGLLSNEIQETSNLTAADVEYLFAPLTKTVENSFSPIK